MLVLCLISALALSIDGLAAGFSLGLRSIRIPATAKTAISLLSAAFAAAAIGFGGLLSQWLPAQLASLFGGLVLLFLGGFGLLHAFSQGARPARRQPPIKRNRPAPLGLTIAVLQDPVQGDLNHSGTIELWEALLLGLCLSVDMLGAGLGLALAGPVSWWGFALLIAAIQSSFLALGNYLGQHACTLPLSSRSCQIAAGGILLVLGAVKLLL